MQFCGFSLKERRWRSAEREAEGVDGGSSITPLPLHILPCSIVNIILKEVRNIILLGMVITVCPTIVDNTLN